MSAEGELRLAKTLDKPEERRGGGSENLSADLHT